jgi:hypothetical protein
MESTGTSPLSSVPEKSSSQKFPESAEEAEDLAARFFSLRSKARRLRAEAAEAEKKAEDLLKSYPLLGNLVGITNKSSKRKAAPEKEPAPSPAKKAKTTTTPAKRTAVYLPGSTMSEKEIAQEGGRVQKKTMAQSGRLERMEH